MPGNSGKNGNAVGVEVSRAQRQKKRIETEITIICINDQVIGK